MDSQIFNISIRLIILHSTLLLNKYDELQEKEVYRTGKNILE